METEDREREHGNYQLVDVAFWGGRSTRGGVNTPGTTSRQERILAWQTMEKRGRNRWERAPDLAVPGRDDTESTQILEILKEAATSVTCCIDREVL